MSAVLAESQVPYTVSAVDNRRYRLISATGATVISAILNLEIKVNKVLADGFEEFESIQVVDSGGDKSEYTAIQALRKPAVIG